MRLLELAYDSLGQVRMLRVPLFLSLLLAIPVAAQEQSKQEDSSPKLLLSDLVLQDSAGRPQSFRQVFDAPIVVVTFLGTECPLAELYAGTLAKLAIEFQQTSVQFLAIDANQQDSLRDMQEFEQRHPLGFPLWKDPKNLAADRFRAERTPEVFVLDSERRIRYHGRIDDQFGIGYRKPNPTRRDLALAIQELLSDKAVAIPTTPAVGCRIGRLRVPKGNADVTWTGQIRPIIEKHCQSCHRAGQIAPFSLTTYDDAQAWGETIGEVVAEQRMPPWGASPDHGIFVNDLSLSKDDKQLIQQWIVAGCPEGSTDKVPPAPKFTEGWQLDRTPDLVLPMAAKPFTVPAEGIVEYQYFVADPMFQEGVWVTAAECRPSNPRIVHHVSIFLLLPEMQKETRSSSDLGNLWALQKNLLATYVPGMRPVTFPEGTAYYLPPGTKIVFQVHYAPIGTVQEDRCQLGILFADPNKVQRKLSTLPLINSWFEIPPRALAFPVAAWHTFQEETLIHGFFPHMHLRGKSFRYIAHFADGSTEVLCAVPKYQFEWQTRYLLLQPRLMPPGSSIQCIAEYDNSPANLSNPDPDSTVRWGDQSYEEMMIGYLDVSIPENEAVVSTPMTQRTSLPWFLSALVLGISFFGLIWLQRQVPRRGHHA